MEATKRPWRADGVTVRAKTSGYAVADCGVGCKGPREANAALIVKAVNCHDKLKALVAEMVADDCPCGGAEPWNCIPCWNKWLKAARAALAECEA